MFLLSVTVMSSPIPNLEAGEEKISGICNCSEFLLRPLSCGPRQMLSMEMGQVWQK